jgi:WD40 repeat protein
LAAALSPDGKTVAWSLEDNSIQLIKLSDHSVASTLEGHPDPVYHLRFSPSGDRLFTTSHDGLVRIWGIDGQQFPPIDIGREVVGFGISHDGSRLATIPFDGPVQLWDLTGNAGIADFGGTGGYDTSDAVFSPDGQYLAADLATGLFLWRISDASLMWNQVKNSMAVAFSPDGRYLAYSNIADNNAVVVASPDGSETIRKIAGMGGPVWELFFSPDSSLLAAAGGEEIRIWAVDEGSLRHEGKALCP